MLGRSVIGGAAVASDSELQKGVCSFRFRLAELMAAVIAADWIPTRRLRRKRDKIARWASNASGAEPLSTVAAIIRSGRNGCAACETEFVNRDH